MVPPGTRRILDLGGGLGGKNDAMTLMTCSGLTHIDYAKGYGPTPRARDRLADKVSLGLLGPFVTMQHQILVRNETETVIDPGFCESAGPTA